MEKVKKTESSKIRYGLNLIQTRNFNLSLPQKKFDTTSYFIDYNINPIIKYNTKDDLVLVTITIVGSIKETLESIFNIETTFVFHVIDLKKLLVTAANSSMKFKDPKNESLIPTLIGVSLSTMRGIVYEKTKGSALDGKHIPLVDPTVFYNKINK